MPLNQVLSEKVLPADMLLSAWEDSTKNAVACGYTAGLIDALMWAGLIDEPDYQKAYSDYVYRGS